MSGSEPSPLIRVQAGSEASDTSPLAPSGYPGFQATTYASRSYTGLAPGYTYQFPGKSCSVSLPPACPRFLGSLTPQGGVWGCMAGGKSACRRLERKGMTEEGAPLPTHPLLTPSPEAGDAGSSMALHGTVLSQAQANLCLPPVFLFSLPHSRVATSTKEGTRLVVGRWGSSPRAKVVCAFLDTRIMTTSYAEPFKAHKIPNGEKQFKSMMITTLICNSK